MLITYIAVGVACVLCARYLWRYLAFRRIYNQLPGPTDTTLLMGDIGNYPGFNEKGLMYDFELAKKFKYFYRMWFGPFWPNIFLFHPDSMKPVFKSTTAPKPRNSGSFYDYLLRWIGEGLVVSNGAHWSRQRRLLTPSFHFDILKNYHDINNACANIMASRLKDATKDGKSVEIYTLLHKMTLDVILRTAFSYESNCQLEGQHSAYTEAVDEMQKLLMRRIMNPLLDNEWIYGWTGDGRRFYKLCDAAHKESESIIARRRQELEANPDLLSQKKKRDFLDILLTSKDEDGVGLTDLEIREEVDTFLVAGHDTTASGTMWTLYELAKHPEHQDKVYEEVHDIIGDGENLAWEDLNRLEYLTQCLKEALRAHSPVTAIDRELSEDLHVDGHVIRKGTSVSLYLWLLHHNPHVWENPQDYLPERFSSDNMRKMHPFQFVPFSAGPRNCIGQHFAMNEMKCVVARIINSFNLKLDPEHKVSPEPYLTLRAENGVYINATRRDS